VVSITALEARVSYDDSEVTQGVPRSEGHLQRFAQSVGGVGQVAGLAFAGVATAGVAMAAGLGISINAAADFQQNMAGVGALLGATSQEMALLSDTALKLGQDTTLSGVGAKEAALAMQELAASGFNAGDIAAGAARGVLLLASATGTDIPTAAQIAGDAFNQFRTSMGLVASDMPMVADLFAGAANASSISLEDIGAAMQYIGPVAASMGISIQDVTATIAELGNQGIKGSGAGTALRSMLVSLASPSKEAAGAIKDLGLQFFDGQGKIKDFAGISEELKLKLAGLTDQQRANALATIFGKEALSAATVLYGEGAAGIQKYLDQITQTGIAAGTGAIRNNTLRGSLASLQGAWETAQIALGQAFLPALKSLADYAANAVAGLIPLVQQYGPVFVAWLTQGIAVLQQWGAAIWGAISAVVGAFQAFQSGQTTLAQFIGGMEIFTSTILGKLGNLAALAAPYIGQFFSAIGGAIATYGPQLVAQMIIWAGYLVDWITDTAIPWVIPKLEAFGQAIWDWLSGTAAPAITDKAIELATALTDWITTTAIPYLQAHVPQWLSALGDWITGTAAPAVIGFLLPLAQSFGEWVTQTAIPYLLSNVPEWLAALVGWWYGTAIPTALAFLVEMGQKFGTWVSETAVPYLMDNIPQWLLALGNYLTGTALPALGNALMTIGKQFGTWITETALPYLQANLPLLMQAFNDWLTSLFPPWLQTWDGLGKALNDWLTGLFPPWLQTWDGLGKALSSAWTSMVTTIGTKIGEAATAVGALPDRVLSALGNLGGLLVSAGSDLIQGLINGITSRAGEVAAAAKRLADEAANAIRGALGIHSPSRVTIEMGQNIGAGLAMGINDQVANVEAATINMAKIIPSGNLSRAGESRAPSSGTGGTTINITGPIYGFDDFKRRVQEAKVALQRQGAWD